MTVELLQPALGRLRLREREVRGKVQSAGGPRQRPEHEAEGEDLRPTGLQKAHLVVQAQLGETFKVEQILLLISDGDLCV